ncbi:MAG: Bax inhibitor-1/YccA family protein [Actinomycetaceae bacterium]|nr:Bax inhibitor-1/YccA family protein [Actinomycetaceae bacterium]
MANPVMNQIDSQIARTPAGYPTMPGYNAGRGTTHPQSGATYADPRQASQASYDPRTAPTQPGYPDAQELNEAYYAPSADAVDRGTITMDDVVVRTGMLLAMVIGAAAVNWYVSILNPALGSTLTMGGAIAGLVLVFVNVFKRSVSPALISAYALCEGLFLGGISVIFEYAYPGIVKEAVVATFAVAAVTLVAYKMKWVRYTAKMNKILIIGLFSLLGYRLLMLVLSVTGLMPAAANFEQITFLGIPLGLIIGFIAVGLATVSLIGDFDTAERAVAARMPKETAWMVGFGIMVTLIWLYTEILRILAILRQD